MKKVIRVSIITLGIVAVFLSGVVFGSAENVRIFVNGSQLASDATIINDRVYVPTRAVSEALGANVEWDGDKRIVNISMTTGNNIVPEVIKNVSPSVVGIIGNLKDGVISDNRYREQIVHGTGVIVKANGEILTNAHVVKDMERIVVVLSDGNGYEASLNCIDEETDLALIKINKFGLKPVRFAKEEDLVIGETAIAIGTPVSFSLRNSASIGIISGVNRSIDSSYRLIQTDAAINPGNSGGPLVNLKGEVVGINSSKFAAEGIEGMGFSIPVSTINYVLKHFESSGRVIRPKLGANFEEDWAARVGLPTNSGLSIIGIGKNSAAEKSGLQVGDVLISINNTNVNTLVDYNEEMKKYIPTNKISLKIKRAGNEKVIECVLE